MRWSMAALYGVSIVLHASLGFGMQKIEPAKEPERIAITVVDAPKPKPKPKEEPPPAPEPEPEPEAPKPKATRLPVAKAAQPAPSEAPAEAAVTDAPSFGIAMTGGVGLGGVAMPVGDSLRGSREPTRRVAEAKTLVQPKPKADAEEACADPLQKPRPIEMARPEYTEEARAAGIEGKVRVELTVDATGRVKSVRVLEGLGHGLDEAAIRAVEGASFEPALACGKPVEATFTVSIRFTL